MRFRPTFLLLVAVLGFASPPAHAANPDAEKQARRWFERAEAHFKAGLFAEALPEYQEGYERLPLPGFLINIAQCQRRLGDLSQARATYRKFLLVAPDSPYVPEVKSLVAEIDQLLESDEQLTPPPAAAVLAEPVASPSPPPGTVLPSAPMADAPSPSSGPRWWLWGSVGGAIVVGVVTAVILARAPDTTTVHDGSLGTLRR
jgi:hypothetical protein